MNHLECEMQSSSDTLQVPQQLALQSIVLDLPDFAWLSKFL